MGRDAASEGSSAAWKAVVVGAVVATVVVLAVMVVLETAVASVIAVAVLFVPGFALLLVRRHDPWGVVLLSLASVLLLAVAVLSRGGDLVHPESFWSFVPMGALVVLAITAVTGVVGALRRAPASGAGLVVGLAGVALLGLLVTGLLSSIGFEDDRRQDGDFGMFAQDDEFRPDALQVPAGTVSLYIGNDDLVRHNFSVDDPGVDAELPAKAFVRVEFEAEPGTHEFRCDLPGHEDMTGTLTVVG